VLTVPAEISAAPAISGVASWNGTDNGGDKIITRPVGFGFILSSGEGKGKYD
jgi:hypothetical protein